ncbi:hypothetical protein RF11_11375 [Thelohanellus kitauei]|uniref:Uncharacterized protein n=1 Tax=Thelohanellus kitauei TaxID=669202 RepID=A0A0C2NK92_THEKT|nr:hypothetical protein RF11_11375 [Thelohanellus kitauei]
MGISCINRCGMIMVVVLIVHFVSTEDKADTNELDSTLRPELLKITDFDFENDNFFVVINDMVPDFTIYFTKEDVKTGKGSIYRYDEDDQKFVAVTFQISANTTVKSLDKLIVTGDKMWAVSKIHEFAFYINKDYKHENAEALEANTEYLVHPNQPDIIIKYTINEVSRLYVLYRTLMFF